MLTQLNVHLLWLLLLLRIGGAVRFDIFSKY